MKQILYAIIDVETTGARAIKDRITEIAIVLFDGRKIIEKYETLVNPETYIPYGITELTGITQEMVEDAPKFYEIGKDIVQLTEGAIFVAHNVRFDYCFIREEFKRLSYTFTRKQLCTVRLSRKAFPELSSHSLGSLINFLQIPVERRHRAMADAMATAIVLEKILDRESNEAEVNSLVNMGIKESLLPKNWTVDKIHDLPDACGVYYFHDEHGNVIYVGKSKNIQKRVATHFARKTEKARKLQQHAFDISFELTGSDLIALLLESQEIKRLHPPINQAQKLKHFPFAIHSFYNEAGYLCFDVIKVNARNRKKYNIVSEHPKLFGAKGHLRRKMDAYELCPKLCGLESGSGSCFNYHLKSCLGGCIQKEAPEAYNARAELAKADLSTVFEEDFIIFDRGRSKEEKSIIVIESGICRGFGYIGLEEADQPFETLSETVRTVDSTPEMTKIIQRIMARKNQKLLVRKR